MVDSRLSFPVAHMSQHHLSIHISDGVDMGNVRLHVLICHDGPSLHLHAQLFQTLDIAVCPASHAHEGLVVGSHINSAVLLKGHYAFRHLFHTAGQIKGHALFLHLLLQESADFTVIGAQHLVQHFDHSHPGADFLKIGSHFKANHAAAHDKQLGRNLCHIQNLIARHHRTVGQAFLYALNRRNHRG